ncbi:dihydrodipicolinate synthase family protein [Gemmatimonadota bacterium Y43]|uniref:dihydrodipicolinate synthase family protein n=1 Tax=Gaopeijia maritima TaxID=3119007 RepID=UPI003273FA22
MTIDLAGVHIPTTTPFDAEGEVDREALRSNLAHLVGQGVQGLVVGGSTGEAVLLDASERRISWEIAREVGADQLLIAGTGAESTRTTVRMCRAAAEAGADAVLVQPPAFYKGAMTPPVLADHYRAVADASPVPVIVYQVPLRMSTLDFPTPLLAELSEHANIVGMKDSRGDLDRLCEVVDATAKGFQMLVGSGALLHAALEAGAVGGILGIANLVPAWCVGIHAAHRSGDESAAARLQSKVSPLHTGIVGGMGVPGVKFGLDRLGLVGGAPRPPLRALAEPGRTAVDALLTEAGLVG